MYFLFCSLATQWHLVAGFGFVRYVGLRYSAAESRLRGSRRFKNRDRDEIWEELHVMELAALPVLNDSVKDE